MTYKYVNYNIGDLVLNPVADVVGIVTKSNYWVEDEYLGSEEEVIDVAFGPSVSKQYPVRYVEKLS
jgi:hypothetical protein|tara:strand:+ start:74 stop:271 length:198 start_codon:yes stop_codon:yes gene_type:complete